MKSLASRRLLSGGIVFALIAFGAVNAAIALLHSPRAVQATTLTSTQQLVETAETGTAVVTAAAR